MPISLNEFANSIRPSSTTLLLGAGSSIPSGAPSSAELARDLIHALDQSELDNPTLAEAAGLVELKFGRRKLYDLLSKRLSKLRPTGGILQLPRFDWLSIYTTNFDTLIEQSFKLADREIDVLRGNADFREGADGAISLHKIHGCISQDVSVGSQHRLVITEADYEAAQKYRQLLFDRMKYEMMRNDVLIVGHSLADPDVRRIINHVLNIKSEQAAPGRVLFLCFEPSTDRALLLEQRGLRVSFGSLDDFMDQLWTRAPAVIPAASSGNTPIASGSRLSTRLVDVSHAMTLDADPHRMFNGRAGSHADISAKLCFDRTLANRIKDEIAAGQYSIASILGPAGVGQTTLARLVCQALVREGFLAWEHKADTYFDGREWVQVADKLTKSGQRAVLLVDECHREMRQLNLLCDHLGKEKSGLHVVASSSGAQWRPRIKSRHFFAPGKGKNFWIDRLEDAELHNLLHFLDSTPRVRDLVDPHFLRNPYQRRFEQLRLRCGSDMFVCLKNLFAADKLDDIILKEYNDLPEDLQDVYRHVAAMESMGIKVHRQLILRCTGLPSEFVSEALHNLRGVVDEYDINEKMGLFGWETRHSIIAQIITAYKFSDQTELASLIERIIGNLNPTINIELRSAIGLCDREYGIGRLSSRDVQNRFYRDIISLIPNERVPRHRLVGNLLSLDKLEEADHEIRQAERTVYLDAPLMRYRVRVGLRRAELSPGLEKTDRRAIASRALEIAKAGVKKYPKDKFMYATECDAARAYVTYGGESTVYAEAIDAMNSAYASILDPEMAEGIRRHESEYRRVMNASL